MVLISADGALPDRHVQGIDLTGEVKSWRHRPADPAGTKWQRRGDRRCSDGWTANQRALKLIGAHGGREHAGARVDRDSDRGHGDAVVRDVRILLRDDLDGT